MPSLRRLSVFVDVAMWIVVLGKRTWSVGKSSRFGQTNAMRLQCVEKAGVDAYVYE